MCEGFEARDVARQEINQRMMQAVKTSHEKEIQACMEAQARLELEISKRDSPAIT